MTTIHFTGTILGGPYDGMKMTFDGTSEETEGDVMRQMNNMKLDDHTYKITEFDKQKKHAVLVW